MNNDTLEPEIIDPDAEYIDGSTALMALNKSEIDVQIATAKQWPRSLKAFKAQALELATLDEETAASMFYVLPRGGKKIEGPSARLAEVVGSSWGNLRYGSRIVATDEKFVTAQGACFDLEKNIAITVEVKRRITDKHGKRYNDDLITVTANAAMSIALRNAIFKVVPFALIKPVYEQAKLCSIGKADSLQARRQRAIEWFVKAGATQEQVLQSIGRAGVEEVTLDDLVTLTGLRTAIKDGDTTIEEVLGPTPDLKSKVRRSDLNDKLRDPTGAHQDLPADHGRVELDESRADAVLASAVLDNVQRELSAAGTITAIAELASIWTQKCPELAEQIGQLAEQCRTEIRSSRGKGKEKLFETHQNT